MKLPAIVTAVWLASSAWTPALAGELPVVTVYKTPTCGCCGRWVEHLEASGFPVKTITLDNLGAVKAARHLPYELASCHTATVAGYTVEGHVPAEIILRLLKEKPDVAGIAVPGMPLGSPGMEMGDRKQPYQVISYTADGEQAVYAEQP